DPGGGHVHAEGQRPVAASRLEVGEDPVLAGCGDGERDGPGAVGGQARVDVLEPGQVAADHDQVQVLVVGGGVAGDGLVVRSEDLEPELSRHAGAEAGCRRDETVATVDHLQ